MQKGTSRMVTVLGPYGKEEDTYTEYGKANLPTLAEIAEMYPRVTVVPLDEEPDYWKGWWCSYHEDGMGNISYAISYAERDPEDESKVRLSQATLITGVIKRVPIC